MYKYANKIFFRIFPIGKGKAKKYNRSKVGAMEKTVDEDALLNPVNRRRPNGEITIIMTTAQEMNSPGGKDNEDGAPPPLPPPRKGASPVTPDVVPSSESNASKLKPPTQLSVQMSENAKVKLHQSFSTPVEGDRVRDLTSPTRSPATPGREEFHPHMERPLPVLPPEIRDDPPKTDPVPISPVSVSGYPAEFPQCPKRVQSSGKVSQLLAQFELKKESSPESSKQLVEEDFKPPLPVRAGEMRPAEEVLIEGLPPPLPAKSKTPPKNQMADMEVRNTSKNILPKQRVPMLKAITHYW